MTPLVRLEGVVAPLLRDDVDTDALIPADYMRSLASDLAAGLFGRWRYREDGREDPAFVLNDPRYRRATMLLAGRNFGCGSSREHAVWALRRFGIRCVIAPGFSDLFRENAFKDGLLPLELPAPQHAALAALARDDGLVVAIDVASRTLDLADGRTFDFALDPRRQARLLAATDEIAETLALAPTIARFREAHRERAPWLYPPLA